MSHERNHSPPGRTQPRERERQQLGMEAPGGNEPPHAQDHWRVDLAQDWEIAFWSREFACSEAELKKAVQAVGSTAGAVRAYLAAGHPQPRT
jgi:hypothetical protein